VGHYSIPLTLFDGDLTSKYWLSVSVDNRPPAWTFPTLTIEVALLKSVVYPIPLYTDPDPGATLSWTCTKNNPTVTMTDCSTGGIPSITITPSISEAGPHTVVFHLFDGIDTTDYTLTITAYNTAPYFMTAFQTSYTSYINSPTSYPLPQI